VGLQLAGHKTEAVLITGRKKLETVVLEVNGHIITSQPSLKYLGVEIDARLTFKKHLETVGDKASVVCQALSRIMPNHGGARHCRRKLLASVISSIILYGAPIWAQALEKRSYRMKIASVYRLSALRVTSAFRTVSDDAICVVAGMPPIDILARERQYAYSQRDTLGPAESRSRARMISLTDWQRRWSESSKGRWTFRLIPDVEVWISRRHGDVNFHLCQILTGHGCFRAYLHRFKHDDSPYCSLCPREQEDVEHVLFKCPRFDGERRILNARLGEVCTIGNMVQLMLISEENWRAVTNAAASIMRSLRNLEIGRRRSQS
jgi:hypothetical protein